MVRSDFQGSLNLGRISKIQTFLPFPNFEKSAQCLDKKRLWKQCLESWQLLRVLSGETTNRWINHPACIMWKGYEDALQEYLNVCLIEWRNRGGKNNSISITTDTRNIDIILPPWFGDDRFHRSHRSNLLHKDYEYYFKYFDDVPLDLPYFWPSQNGY